MEEQLEKSWKVAGPGITISFWSHGAVLTGQLTVSPLVIYLTALSGYTQATGAINPGSAKRIEFSAASESHPVWKIMVCLTIRGQFLINLFN